MKTIDDILTVAFVKLADDHSTVTIYKDKHPTFQGMDEDPSEFFVINSLPVMTGVVERGLINVNVYVDELGHGQPDHSTLDGYVKSVISSLDEYNSDGVEFYYDEHKSEPSRLKAKDLMNVRFEVFAENG